MKRYLCILSFLFFYIATYADNNILESGADRLVEAIYTGASDFISYDANGNMTMDLNKGIERVTYDHNNLPKEILLKSRKSCRYTYDSSGRKLRAEYRTPRAMIHKATSADAEARVGGVGRYVVTTIDYCGDNEYRNGALLRTHLPNGYIENDSMYFYVNDSHGNVRCVVRQDGAVVESNEYYPYGGLFCAAASVQPYKYGAKELDRMHGIDLYDSEARWYDPVLGRTTTMDPLAGKYPGLSPYLWCAANPLKHIDERGNSIAILSFQQDGWRHIALLIQDNDNKWRYFSVNGDVVWNESYGLLGLPKDDLGEKSFESPQEFLNSEYNSSGFFLNRKINCYGYDVAYIVPSSSNQDKIMVDSFKNSSKKRYNLFTNNCATAVKNAINKAFNTKIGSWWPDSSYNEIKNVLSGKEIKK